MTKIKDLPCFARPREKLIEKGPANLKDKELLAILLGTGRAGKSVLEIAQEILSKHPMKNLLVLDYKKLAEIKGIGSSKACSLLAAFEITKRALEVEDNNLPAINSAREAVAQLQELRTAKKENFVVLYLNARNQLIHKEIISVGTLNASLVHPREVFKPAIDHLSAGIIIAHNHPSGELVTSEEDIKVTKRLTGAGEMLGIDVLDHLIVVENSFLSLRESGVF